MLSHLLTWRLWRALWRPPMMHPLYQQLIGQRKREGWFQIRNAFWVTIGFAILLMIAYMPIIGFWLMVSGPIWYGCLNTLLLGSLWTMDIAGTVARDRSQQRYDLHCLIPDGVTGVHWIMIAARLHYQGVLERSMGEIQGVIQVVLFVDLLVLIGLALAISSPSRESLLELFVLILSIAWFIYIDRIHAILTGSLIGLSIGQRTQLVGNARLWSFGLFLLSQMLWYLLIVIGIFVLIPLIFQILGTESVWVSIAMPLIVLSVLFMLREMILRRLWRGLQADMDEFQQLERFV
ncbi:MAG: hypothetical protein MUF87_12470 [Anaerolineae bacterium]|jgi:hypothetical protein|nr:hypothetical protein [Anaerolineae bacterium]